MTLTSPCRTFVLFVIQASLLSPSQAGIFKDQESLEKAHVKAKTFQEKILPGKIVVRNSGRKIWSEFLSATPIGTPESTQTRTILSSAHNFLLSDVKSKWRTSDKPYKMYYCDSLGKEYPIIDAIKLTPKPVDASNDIALYYLNDYLPCNPLNTIERDLSQDVTLSALCCGWSVISTDTPSACNFLGQKPYYLQNEMYLNSDNVYAHIYSVDRMLHLSNIYNEHRYSYLANNSTSSVHQTYAHDSGSSWFKENNVGGYSLTALASEEQVVTNDIIRTMDREDNFLGKAQFMDDIYTMKVHRLDKSRLAVNLFTPLAPHREWIFQQIR